MSKSKLQNTPKSKGSDNQIVLVVDARPMRQFYTSIFLQRLKYQVIMAKTAEDGLLFLGLTIPLILIANYDLPQMTGLDLLKRVKDDKRMRNIPFIFYTSNRSPKVRQNCEQAGCSSFLCHPCSLEELYAAIQKATQAKPRKPRRFVRLTTALNVVVEDGRIADDANDNIITAISEQGMFVSTSVPLAIGKKLPFTFHLPNAPGWLIRVEGQVLFNNLGAKKPQIPGMAIKFLKIGNQEQEFVRDFIRQELMEGIIPDETQTALPATLSGATYEGTGQEQVSQALPS